MTAMCQNGAPQHATKTWCFRFLPVHTHVTQSRGIWHRFCVFVTLLNVALLQALALVLVLTKRRPGKGANFLP